MLQSHVHTPNPTPTRTVLSAQAQPQQRFFLVDPQIKNNQNQKDQQVSPELSGSGQF